LADFDGQNVAGWLYQIARRKVRDYRRLLWVKHLFASSNAPLAEDTVKSLQGPLDALETSEKRRLLTQLLEALNEDQRAAFVLFEIEGKSGEEIAELQAAPLNTVWARIHKARKKLQQRAERYERQQSRRVGT
jgi:RNA polymerase sigma-70 factor (ECF subfamily)